MPDEIDNTPVVKRCTLQLDVHYNQDLTDPPSIAECLDGLLAQVTQTLGVLEDIGDPQIGDIEAVGELAMLSVVVKSGDAANTIREYRLIGSEKADEALLDACSRYVSNWDEHTSDDHTAICDNGYYETGHHHISVIHLDQDGCFNP